MNDWMPRGVNGMRKLRQALASPHPVALQAIPRGTRMMEENGQVSSTLKRFAPCVFALVLLAGCALTYHPRIADLKYNPGRYQNRNVTIEGVVTNAFGIPMVPFKLYKVDDGTGEVTVISQDGRVPSRGARVRVRGRVENIATFGGQSIGLHIREEHLSFRRRW